MESAERQQALVLAFSAGMGANLKGAELWDANLQATELWDANLQDAKLWRANLEGAILRGANLQDAKLWGANLKGANLGAKAEGEAHTNPLRLVYWGTMPLNPKDVALMRATLRDMRARAREPLIPLAPRQRDLAQQQLDTADVDEFTMLPDGLTRPAHWAKAEGPEAPPSAQPKDAENAPAASGAPGPVK